MPPSFSASYGTESPIFCLQAEVHGPSPKVAETTPASIKQLSLAEFYLTSLYTYRFGFTIIILLLLKGQWFTRVHGGRMLSNH